MLVSTILLVSFAILLTAVRIVAWRAPSLEQSVNNLLESTGIEVEGLKARCSGLNLIVEIDSVSGSGFTLNGVQTEIDFFKTLMRNRIALETVKISDLQFDLKRGDSGWSLGTGEQSEGGLGLFGAIGDTSTLDIQFSGSFDSQTVVESVSGFAKASTESGVRVFHLSLAQVGSPEGHGLNVHWQNQRSSVFFGDRVHTVSINANEFDVDPDLLLVDYLIPLKLSGHADLVIRNRTGKLSSTFELTSLDAEESKTSFSGQIKGHLVSNELFGEVLVSVSANADEEHSVPPIKFVHLPSLSRLQAWSTNGQLDDLVFLVQRLTQRDHALHRWVHNLSPSGTYSSFQFMLDNGVPFYRVSADQFEVQRYSGIPNLSFDQVEILGSARSLLVRPLGGNIEAVHDEVLKTPIILANVNGRALVSIQPNCVGVNVDIASSKFNTSSLRGAFGYFSDLVHGLSTTGVALDTDQLSGEQVMNLLPLNLADSVHEWVETKLVQGVSHDAKVVVFASNSELESPLRVSVEASSRLSDVAVSFHQDWPLIEEGTGTLLLTRDKISISTESAYSQGIHSNWANVELEFGSNEVKLQLLADAPTSLLEDYIESTPLHTLLNLGNTKLGTAGSIDVVADVLLPLDDREPSIDLSLTFLSTTLDIPDAGTLVENLNGQLHFTFPFEFSSTDLHGSVFGSPGTIEVHTEFSNEQNAVLHIDVSGTFAPQDFVHFTGNWVTEIMQGESDFQLNMQIPRESQRSMQFVVESNFEGMSFDLPSPFGKTADESRKSFVRMELAEITTVEFVAEELISEFYLQRGQPLSGSIGLNVPPLPYGSEDSGVLITGKMDFFDLAFGGNSNGSELGFPIHFRDLKVDRVRTGELIFESVEVDGVFSKSSVDLSISSEQVQGHVARVEGGRWAVDIDRLQIEKSDAVSEGSLTGDLVKDLPSIDLSIDTILYVHGDGDTSNFGTWYMSLDHVDDELRISNLVAEVRGLAISGGDESGLVWDLESNTTSYKGMVTSSNLEDVLPQWNYEQSVECESMTIDIDLEWEGSPLDFDLYRTRGSLVGSLDNGRFLDVGSSAGAGALRLVGLLNFSTVLQRLRLDFKDVFSKGMSFNRILFDVDLEEGVARLEEPLHIKSSGSDIFFGGTMDLNANTLSSEVVVTLPLSSSLPWYVAIATANPVALIGAYAGKKIFENQLDRMASSKYRVSGTISDPNIEFVGLFRDKIESEGADNSETNENFPEDQTQ